MNKILKIGLTAIALVLFGCARVQDPPGGPPDTTPPMIVATTPQERTLQFSGNSVVLEFNEYVDRSGAQANVFISPPVRFDTDWSGRDLEIEFTEPLQPQTTYAVTVGTEFTDRAGNKPREAYTLIFSTGDKLDSGVIRGTLLAQEPGGAFVFLYPLSGIQPDTLNPSVTKPKYRTQVGANGTFAFQALPPGSYRLIAVRDEFRNEVFDPGVDAFGTTTEDITIAEGEATDVVLRLGPAVDMTPPEVYGASSLSTGLLRVEFSEALDTASVEPASFRLTPVGTDGASLGIRAAYLSPFRRFSVHLLAERAAEPGSEWQLTALAVRDSAGNIVSDTARTATVTIADQADTLVPYIVEAPFADSASGISLSGPYRIVWSTAPDSESVRAAIRLQRADGADVPIDIRRPDDNITDVVPQNPLLGDTTYTLIIAVRSVRSISGAAGRDTTVNLFFGTVDPGNYGILAGSIVDTTGRACSSYILTLAAKNGTIVFRKQLNSAGPWEFTDVPPGSYTLSAFCDADGDGVYSYGEAFPFTPAERFVEYPQEITVRPRWTVENVVVLFR